MHALCTEPSWMTRCNCFLVNSIYKHLHRHHHHVKVWILGGFNEDYDWQEGEEGFLSSTEVFGVGSIVIISAVAVVIIVVL